MSVTSVVSVTEAPPMAAKVDAPVGGSLPYGILSVATEVTSAFGPWAESGAAWDSPVCDPPMVVDGICDGRPAGATEVELPDWDDLWASAGIGHGGSYPFTVMGYAQCNAVGLDYERAARRATEHVNLGLEAAIEKTIESGLTGNVKPYFGDAEDVTPTPGTAVGLAQGIALLEAKIASVPGVGQGVLHMNRFTASIAGDRLEPGDTVLTTRLGTPVVAGSGYTGTVEVDTVTPAAGEFWIYATGTPRVWASGVEVLEDAPASVGRTNNRRQVVATREAMVAWSCLTAAVLVDPTQ